MDSENKRAWRPIGKSKLSIPQIGLGTATFGNLYTDVSLEDARATVERAFQVGMRFCDTAPLYGAGESESKLGKILPNYERESYVLASKVGNIISDNGTIIRDLSRDAILRSIEASLHRMNLDSLDIVHIHDPDNHEDGLKKALDIAFPTLAELREQKVIKAVGSGMNQWQMLYEFAKSADFDCFLLAGRYTLLEQEPLETFFPFCQAKGISLILGGIYNSGILATGVVEGAKFQYSDAPQHIVESVRSIQIVCDRHHVSLQTAALQFPLAHPAVTGIIVGARNEQEINSIQSGRDVRIPNEFWDELKIEGLLHKDAPTPN